MKTDLWEQVYESLTCHPSDLYQMPGVVNAFADDAYCMEQYRQMRNAYDRLHVADEDKDVECIIQCYMGIQRELCRLMFLYGQQYPSSG